jgi:hypothetical protein
MKIRLKVKEERHAPAARKTITQRMVPMTIGSAQDWRKIEESVDTLHTIGGISKDATTTGEGNHWVYMREEEIVTPAAALRAAGTASGAAPAVPAVPVPAAPEFYKSLKPGALFSGAQGDDVEDDDADSPWNQRPISALASSPSIRLNRLKSATIPN